MNVIREEKELWVTGWVLGYINIERLGNGGGICKGWGEVSEKIENEGRVFWNGKAIVF